MTKYKNNYNYNCIEKTLILTDIFLGNMNLDNLLGLIDIQRPQLIINNCDEMSELVKQAMKIQGYTIIK